MMTLHEAIEMVLREAARPLTCKEIANAVNRKGLYARKDGKPVPSGQISARVNCYPLLFDVNTCNHPHTVSLKSIMLLK